MNRPTAQASRGQSIGKMSAAQLRKLVRQLQARLGEGESGDADRQDASARCDLAQLPVAVVCWDQMGVVLDANPPAAQLLGVEAGLLPGKRIVEWVAPSSRKSFSRFSQQVFDAGAIQGCEIQLQRRDGSRLEIRLEGQLLNQGPEGAASCQAVLIDITESKLAQQARERERARTEAQYLDVAEVIVLVIGRDEKILRINRKGLRVLGYSKEEIVGQSWFDLALPEDKREEIRRVFHEIVGAGDPAGLHGYREDYVVTKSGEKRLIAWNNTVLTDGSGRIIASLSSGEDITDRRRAEEALTRTQRLNQAVLDTCIEGIITIDEQGMIKSFNPAAERIFGYASQEVLGTNMRYLLPLEERESHDDYFRSLAAGSGRALASDKEVTGQRKDGNLFPMRLGFGEAFLFEQHRAFVCIVRDLTEVKAMQEELEQNRVFAALGEMSASVAHEIKNPLAAISGVVQVLLDSIGRQDPRREILVELAGRIQQMDGTVKRLLRFARPWTLDRQHFDLREIVEEVVDSARKMERFENISFVVEPGQSARVLVDLVLFQDVLWNLLYNADEAMPLGGEVRLAIGNHRSLTTLCVSDSGPGIDPEVLRKVFRPLFTTKSRGTGLGLAHCKKVMEAHGGSIHIANLADGGAQVTLHIPQAAAAQS